MRSSPSADSPIDTPSAHRRDHSAAAGVRTLRLFISAGEVSGDLYGANLVQTLHRVAAVRGFAPDIRALGGPRMAKAGARLLADTAARAAVGFVEPLRYLAPSLLAVARVRRLLASWRPDAAILIDYPGFNIPLAGILKKRGGFPLVYYLPPEECIWGKKGHQHLDRAHLVCSRADLLLTSHGRDTDFYRAQGCRAERIGHPILDLVGTDPIHRTEAREAVAPGIQGPVVALFPASRRLELGLIWPVLAQAAVHMLRVRSDLRFIVPLAGPHLRPPFDTALARTRRDHPELVGRLNLISAGTGGETPADLAMAVADLAIAKAGSVTLELALRGVPQIMVYRVDRVTEWIGRRILGLSERDFEHMALPNFLLGEGLVPEFKQHGADPHQIAATALALLDHDGAARTDQLAGLSRLRDHLGGPGAVERAAAAIMDLIVRECPPGVSAAPPA